jgi:hypothetical protein
VTVSRFRGRRLPLMTLPPPCELGDVATVMARRTVVMAAGTKTACTVIVSPPVRVVVPGGWK